jgi:hypothetical protein
LFRAKWSRLSGSDRDPALRAASTECPAAGRNST